MKPPRKVEVEPYKEGWPERFTEEAAILIEALASDRAVFHHIGSTSVPGLNAKPIIDILAEADSLGFFDEAVDKLRLAGYEPRGENGIPGRRYFIKYDSNGERVVHLHAFEKGSQQIIRHLAFRDYLRVHPLRAAQYGKVKETAAAMFPNDISSYIDYKEKTVLEIEKEALEWAGIRE
ncbi:GrpB family protein [Neobacillus piezotolerans]|uniref:GrpB family protein n=1 Tax=Neobacillus piezotolerans TaxID=2259171 RepID=A0A3D8GKQ4_9BACI|nr:GrpB family protein [Neobacillus piezotolerans]RDU34988.1 GrpB family protein [Neobacillus piezotolerans]